VRGFAFVCFFAATALALAGIYALTNWSGRAFWLFWIAAVFMALWGRNCLRARTSDDHDDSPLYAMIRSARLWW